MISGPDSRPILDVAHLQRRTMGDEGMRTELLSLFSVEAERLMRQIEEADTPRLRCDRIIAMREAARDIGARRLEAVAAELARAAPEAPADTFRLRQALLEVLDHTRRSAS